MAIARRESVGSYFRNLSLLKKLFWLYFLLLIFEGALRKWVMPQYSAPLLIVRDPVGLMIIWEAYRTHKWPRRWAAVIQLLTVGLIGFSVLQMVYGGNPWFAGLFGLRSYLLPFPVAFIMGENLDQEDLRRFGTCTLFLLLPLTLVAIDQYNSPGTALINAGSTHGGKQIMYVGARVRASGTFSFVIGMSQFGTLVGAFLFYAIVKPEFASKWLLWSSACALMVAIPMIGARALVVQLAAVLACVVIAALLGVVQFGKTLRVLLPILILLGLASLLPIFSSAMTSLAERISGANIEEGGSSGSWAEVIYYRTLEPDVEMYEMAAASDRWMGTGMGSGAIAIQAIANGSLESAGEDEISRELIEMGVFMGTAFEIFKWLLAIWVFAAALRQVRQGEPLALLLVPLTISALLLSVPEQPTEQGFMVMGLAFSVAAAKLQVHAMAPAPVPLALQRQQMLARQQMLMRRRRVQRG